MKSIVALLLFGCAFVFGPASADPLEGSFHDFLASLLSDMSAQSWPLSYNLSNYQADLIQESAGRVNLSGRVVGPTEVSLGDDLEVLRLNDSVNVTAAVDLSGVSFNIDFEVNSSLSGNIHQKMVDLEGRMTVAANITDPSSANMTLLSFELSRDIKITSSGMNGDDITTELQTEIPEAVTGVFKKNVIPNFQDELTSKLAAALEGRTLNISEALAATTTSTTTSTTVAPTTALTTASTTAPSTAPTTTPASAPTSATAAASTSSPSDETQAPTSSTTSAPSASTTPTSPSPASPADQEDDHGSSAAVPSMHVPRGLMLILSAHAAILLVTKSAL